MATGPGLDVRVTTTTLDALTAGFLMTASLWPQLNSPVPHRGLRVTVLMFPLNMRPAGKRI